MDFPTQLAGELPGGPRSRVWGHHHRYWEERPELEFHGEGEAHIVRPSNMAEISDEVIRIRDGITCPIEKTAALGDTHALSDE